MTNASIYSQFIEAGMRLYPQYGYRKLSVRLLAAEAGVSSGMFHHLFVDKDAFVEELLNNKRKQIFGTLHLDCPANAPPLDRLRQMVWQLAINIRDNLAWLHRVFADGADQVAVVEKFMHAHFSDSASRFLTLLDECRAGTQADLLHRWSYLCGSIFAPMIIGARLSDMGVLPALLENYVPEILSDAAIARRIEWTFAVLFPSVSQEES